MVWMAAILESPQGLIPDRCRGSDLKNEGPVFVAEVSRDRTCCVGPEKRLTAPSGYADADIGHANESVGSQIGIDSASELLEGITLWACGSPRDFTPDTGAIICELLEAFFLVVLE